MSVIKWLLVDVDGTLTDGKIYYGNDGEELKAFNVKDGLALRVWKMLGKKIAIITGRESQIVERRARELGVDEVFTGVKNKGEIVELLQEKYHLKKEELACVGDDLNDLPMFARCALSFAPKDSAILIQNRAFKVLCANGGEGAVRETVEIILKEEGLEEKCLEFFL